MRKFTNLCKDRETLPTIISFNEIVYATIIKDPFSCTSNNIALDEFEPITALLLSLSPSQTPRFCLFYIYRNCKYFFTMKLNWFKYNQKPSNEDLLNILKRIERAYNIVELNKQEQIIFEKDRQQQLFDVQSTNDKSKSYEVNPDIKTCTCPDFNFRLLKCKHIIAVELVSLLSSLPQTSPQSLSPSPASASSVIAS
jgi:hypothetical protein